MADDVLITCEGVSKKFCRSLKRSLWYGVQDMAREVAGAHSDHDHLRKDEFWAVNDVFFELRRGECLGLIGHNGAGKTTLLRMLNGLIKPDRGRIEMRGRVGALIALGAGFNPLLTGRENIYVNASVLGLSYQEISRRIEQIIDFADLKDFIDAPVQSYSSGMTVRLGFAVATTLEPDILILDEVLAVGDAAFRAKCYNEIGRLRKNAAVLFVSHNMQQISHVCSSVLLLQKGKPVAYGDVADGVNRYLATTAGGEGEKTLIVSPPVRRATLSFTPETLGYGENLTARLGLLLDAPIRNATIRVTAYNSTGLVVAEWNSKQRGVRVDFDAGESSLEIELGPLHLGPGTYRMALALNDATGVMLPFWSLKNDSVTLRGTTTGACEYQLSHNRIDCSACTT